MGLKDDLTTTSDAYESNFLAREALGLEAELRNAANHGHKSLFFRTKTNPNPNALPSKGQNPVIEAFLKAEDLTWKLLTPIDGYESTGYLISWN